MNFKLDNYLQEINIWNGLWFSSRIALPRQGRNADMQGIAHISPASRQDV